MLELFFVVGVERGGLGGGFERDGLPLAVKAGYSRELLELAFYRKARVFDGERSRRICSVEGDGLPEQCWDEETPDQKKT